MRRVEESDDRPVITTKEGVSLGMLIMGLLGQISKLGESED
jgi:hypothetical protein